MSNPTLVARDLLLGYGGEPLLPAVSFTVEPSEVVSIVGHNGCGKSTLLKTLVGLKNPLGGQVEWNDTTRDPSDRTGAFFAYVPQRETLDSIYPVRVEDFCATGRFAFRGVGRRLKASDYEVVRERLEEMGAWGLRKRLFRTLSGGEQQRVLIARALAMEPRCLVLDEPTANMDHRGASAVMSLSVKLAKSHGVAIVMVNHFLDIVQKVSDKVVFLDRDQQIVKIGNTSDMLKEFTAHV